MRHVRLRLAFGQDLLLVPSHAVQRLARSQAEELARVLLDRDDGPDHIREVLRVSADVGEESLREMLVLMLCAGDLVMVQLEDPDATWHPPRSAPTTSLSDLLEDVPMRKTRPVEPELPTLVRVELGAMDFGPLGVLALPKRDGGHRWAALVTAASHLRDHPGSGLVIVGHRRSDEPAEISDLRARALMSFLVGDRNAWLGIAAKWGRVADTQEFLGYLALEEGWPIDPVEVDGVAGEATAGAVLDFQRSVNARQVSAQIFEDGVIGEQTLGAIYDVARSGFGQWLLANGLREQWPLHDASLPTLDCGDRYKPFRTLPVFPPRDSGRLVDLVIVPADQAAKVALARAPQGSAVYEVESIRTLSIAAIDPRRTALGLEIVLRHELGQAMADVRFEVVDPSGGLHAGVLDAHGEARLEGLPAGLCRVRFPELADGRWYLEGTTTLPTRP